MNTKIAKKLMMTESPIKYKNIEYEKITSLIFKKTDKGIISSAELLDKNKNSVRTVFLKDIETESNLKDDNVNINEDYFQELMTELRKSAFPAVNCLGIGKYKKSLVFIRTILRVLPELEEIAQQRALQEKKDTEEN